MSNEDVKIVVLDGHTVNPGDNSWDGLAELGDVMVYERTPPELVRERAAEAQIVLTNKTVLDAALLADLPMLRFISVLATGYNVVDVVAAGKQGIPVANVPAYSSLTVAQHTIALMLELANCVGLHDSAVKSGEWSASRDFCFWKQPLTELDGLVLGIVGFGSIGRAVARIAQALGMAVIVHTPHPPASVDGEAIRFVSLDELCATADVVSLHCPQTPRNTGFVDKAFLSGMKPTAWLINTARGALINEQDLADALTRGVLAAAALDVVAREPVVPDNPLLTAPNCIITPHVAWAALAARRRLMRQSVANVAAFLAGTPVNVVNADYLGALP